MNFIVPKEDRDELDDLIDEGIRKRNEIGKSLPDAGTFYWLNKAIPGWDMPGEKEAITGKAGSKKSQSEPQISSFLPKAKDVFQKTSNSILSSVKDVVTKATPSQFNFSIPESSRMPQKIKPTKFTGQTGMMNLTIPYESKGKMVRDRQEPAPSIFGSLQMEVENQKEPTPFLSVGKWRGQYSSRSPPKEEQPIIQSIFSTITETIPKNVTQQIQSIAKTLLPEVVSMETETRGQKRRSERNLSKTPMTKKMGLLDTTLDILPSEEEKREQALGIATYVSPLASWDSSSATKVNYKEYKKEASRSLVRVNQPFIPLVTNNQPDIFTPKDIVVSNTINMSNLRTNTKRTRGRSASVLQPSTKTEKPQPRDILFPMENPVEIPIPPKVAAQMNNMTQNIEETIKTASTFVPLNPTYNASSFSGAVPLTEEQELLRQLAGLKKMKKKYKQQNRKTTSLENKIFDLKKRLGLPITKTRKK